MMSRFFTGGQRTYKVVYLFQRASLCFLGIICAGIGLGLSYLAGLLLQAVWTGRAAYSDPAFLLMFGFAVLIALLFINFAFRAFRDAIQSPDSRWLDGVDLDKQPWMANAEWRNRRIVEFGLHQARWPFRLALVFFGGLLLGGLTLTGLSQPTDAAELALTVAVSGVIAVGLGYFYWQLKERNVTHPFAVLLTVPILLNALFLATQSDLVVGVAALTWVSTFAIVLGYRYLEKRKFGISICHLRTLPAFIGGAFEAEIEIPSRKRNTSLPGLPEGSFEAELANVTQVSRGNETINWSARLAVPLHAVTQPGDGTIRIAVRIEIPNEVSNKIPAVSGWKLQVRASFPGLDYAAWFPVPVYLPESAG